jgi:hypothetical protein
MKTKSKLEEKKLTKAELEAREKVIKDLKKNKSALVKRYGKDAEAVMYGRATNIAKKMAESENKNRIKELVRKALMQEADIEVMADKYGEEKALGQAAMMLDALEEKLKKHDWWYMMSDDDRWYRDGRIQEDEIRKIMKELESIGYSEDAKALFNKYAPDGPGGTSLKLKEVVIASEMTTEEASKIADRFAKYMSNKDKEGKKFTVTAGSVDGPSFDLNLNGVKYDGGSYIISTAGEILNMALPEHPVYAKMDDLKDIDENITDPKGKPDGEINSLDYLKKRNDAIQKAKGEMKEGELEEAYVPSNIKEFAKRKGATSLVNKVAGWAEKVGKGIRGGTAIGKNYSTLVLDLGYQDGSIRINLDDDIVELYGEEVFDAKSFRQVYLANQEESKDNPAEKEVNEDIDLGHEDNEPHMIKGELYQIGKYAMKLYATLEELEETGEEIDFPAWWQSKITTAKNMMSGAKHYLDFELKEPYIDAAVDAATGEAPHMGEPEAPMMEAEGNLKQDIVDFWGTQQDDAAQSDGEYEAEWDTEFFIDNYPQYEGKEQEINNIVKTLQINEAEIGKDEILAGKIMKALKDMANKDASDQNNLKQARTALNKGNMDAAKKIAKPYLSEKIAKLLKSK